MLWIHLVEFYWTGIVKLAAEVRTNPQMTASIVLGMPCFFSDGFSCYYNALIECYHKIKILPRTGKKGRPKDPVKEPRPDLVYGQIVKENEGGRIVKITYRIKCGVKRFKQLGLKISTTLLERLNLTIRQALSPLVRKPLGFSKKRENLRKQTIFFKHSTMLRGLIRVFGKKLFKQIIFLFKDGHRRHLVWLQG